MLCVPAVAFVPVQPPEAEQLAAFVVDHVSWDALADFTLVGAAVKDNVGAPAAAIDTEAERVTVPPAPVHASV